ncbi:LytR family transcriptional regulator [Glaciibacter flavus]|uniref:LytR family transcriptional regulator n=1 Tax=Orlajensenia flava TaxID=2565934 RepID=A0A4S4FZE6_9MICO|nr:LytR C-terminal domain-containing protein [Glaciibacter flavus]THG35751.1 LytR family transcriptional regulator [Glaciibacter flavus]
MPASFPPDRFDEIPGDLDRVGAHRAPRKRGRGWIAFGWAALATVVLIAAGAIGIMVLNNGLDFTAGPASSSSATPPASAVPTAAPTVDPSLSVTVLNGTDTAGLAAKAATALTGAGWTVGATSNASASDVKTTTVYYADPTLEGAARGVSGTLPGSSVALSSDFADSGAQIVVVLGADYKPAA